MKLPHDKRDALGAKVAPAVGLLLFCESALAQDDDDGPPVAISEPSALALLAVAAAGAGAVRFVKKRGKKK